MLCQIYKQWHQFVYFSGMNGGGGVLGCLCMFVFYVLKVL